MSSGRKYLFVKLGYKLKESDIPTEIILRIFSYIPYWNIKTCTNSYCYNDAIVGELLCTKHICSVTGCRELTGGLELCSTHKCEDMNCYKRVLPGSIYCIFHKCTLVGCYNKVYDANWCERHVLEQMRCRVDGCILQPTALGKYYCFIHRCRCENCPMPKIKNKEYCNACICAEDGCDFKRHKTYVGIKSEYCIGHKCGYSNCIRKSLPHSMYCILCG